MALDHREDATRAPGQVAATMCGNEALRELGATHEDVERQMRLARWSTSTMMTLPTSWPLADRNEVVVADARTTRTLEWAG